MLQGSIKLFLLTKESYLQTYCCILSWKCDDVGNIRKYTTHKEFVPAATKINGNYKPVGLM